VKEITVTSSNISLSLQNLERTTGVSVKDVVTNINTKTQITATEDTNFQVNFNNYGESSPRQPQLFHYNSDDLSSYDLFLNNIGKNQNEILSKIDFAFFTINRNIVENLNSIERLSLDFSTIKSDTLINSDLRELSIGKPFEENLISFESRSLSISSQKEELTQLSETLFKKDVEIVFYEGLVKYALSDYFLNDYVVGPILLSDEVTTLWDIRPVFNETLIATDDFYGLANIDDDQIASFGKVLNEQLEASEVISQSFSTFKFETFGIGDTYSNGVFKNNEETILTSEEKYFQNSKTQIDNANLIESVSNNLEKINNETFSYSDILSSILDKSIQDISNTTDSLIINQGYGRQINETLSSSDGGLINVQDYFLNSFADVGYAGNNTLF
jgi:hypothetical protein